MRRVPCDVIHIIGMSSCKSRGSPGFHLSRPSTPGARSQKIGFTYTFFWHPDSCHFIDPDSRKFLSVTVPRDMCHGLRAWKFVIAWFEGRKSRCLFAHWDAKSRNRSQKGAKTWLSYMNSTCVERNMKWRRWWPFRKWYLFLFRSWGHGRHMYLLVSGKTWRINRSESGVSIPKMFFVLFCFWLSTSKF